MENQQQCPHPGPIPASDVNTNNNHLFLLHLPRRSQTQVLQIVDLHVQRCALDGGNCILWRCGQNSTLRLQATAGERAQPDATELHLRVPSAAGAIR